MSMNKAEKLWFVNIISFGLLSILTLTGLINWWFIPRGGGAEGGFAVLLRHFLRQVHEWTALMFIVIIVIHLALHWAHIKSNLQNYGILK
jgi:thiosulfate reductase cytochrome b subunit